MNNRNNFYLSLITWNLYIGADPAPIISTMPNQLPERVTDVFRQFLATNISARVKKIADGIALKQPDIVNLQEAALCQLVTPGIRTVVYDFVQLLLQELSQRGLSYEVAVLNRNSAAELPDSNGNLIRFLDRDVILIRKRSGLRIINKMGANYTAYLRVKIGEQKFKILRGWSCVDIKGEENIFFRVINSHLESYDPAVQVKQARELLRGPANTELPLVITGDLNTNPDGGGTLTYGDLIKAGFYDTWKDVSLDAGFTGCHGTDLINAESGLKERIDFVLHKNGWQSIMAELVGERQENRTCEGLWPSDHAGVAVWLGLNCDDSFFR